MFVAFSVKAAHLELVADLSKKHFLAALRHFVARRGKLRELHSDNGTNFVGANNELKELYSCLKTKTFKIPFITTALLMVSSGISFQRGHPTSVVCGRPWSKPPRNI